MPKVLKICLVIAIIAVSFSLIGHLLNYLKQRQLNVLGIDPEQLNYSLPEATTTPEFLLSPEMEDFSKQVDYQDILNPVERINKILKEKGFPVYGADKTDDNSYKDFTSPDGRLSLQYPSSWMITPQDKLEEISAKQTAFHNETIFMAYSPNIESIGQLIVSEQTYEEARDFNQVIEEMEQSNQGQGWNMKVLDKNQKDEGDLLFHAEYKKDDRYSVFSKERIISVGTETGTQKIYTVAFTSIDKYWDEMKGKADFVIDSVEIAPTAGFNGD